MPTPDPDVENVPVGNVGSATLHCNWTSAENDDLTDFVFLDTEDAKYYDNPRYAIKTLDWTCSSSVQVVVEFESLGSRRVIHAIPEEATSGSVDFSDEPSGCISDPFREVPSNVVVTTTGALPGDRLFLRTTYKIKGKVPAMGVLTRGTG